MIKLNERFVINKNDDLTVTIYDLQNDKYYNLNHSASIVFENIDKSDYEIYTIFEMIFDQIDESTLKDINNIRNKLSDLFFYEKLDI